MPFRENSPVEERIALMRAFESGAFTVAELAASYGVSRETVYQWKRQRVDQPAASNKSGNAERRHR